MSTLEEKLVICIWSAALFILVNLPQTYSLTSSLTTLNLYDSETNCPTNLGIFVHTLVFFILTYLSMWRSDLSSGLKLKFSIYGTLIFYFISSPALFSLMSSMFGDKVASLNGCQTAFGTVVNSALYFLALLGVMYLPPELE